MTHIWKLGNSLIFATPMIGEQVFLITALTNLPAVAHYSNQHSAFRTLVGSKHMSPKSVLRSRTKHIIFFLINSLTSLSSAQMADPHQADWFCWLNLDARCFCSYIHFYKYLFRWVQQRWGAGWLGGSTFLSPLWKGNRKSVFPLSL